MKFSIAVVLAVAVAADTVPPQPVTQEEMTVLLNDTLLSAEFRHQLDTLSSPALDARKAERRKLQRAGYANVLAGVLDDDGVGAFLSLARMNAQLEYAMSHRPLFVYITPSSPPERKNFPQYLFTYKSGPIQVVLKDDWSMPEDPWQH